MEHEFKCLISKLTINFEKSIPSNETEKEKLVEAFRKYLELAVITIQNSKSKFIRKDSKSINRVLENIARDLCDTNIISKKQNLLEDKNLGKIQQISGEVFDLAKKKKTGDNISAGFDISSKIEELKILLDGVASYNATQAKELVSETVLDLKYVCENEENISSLRLHHFVKSLKQKDEEER